MSAPLDQPLKQPALANLPLPKLSKIPSSFLGRKITPHSKMAAALITLTLLVAAVACIALFPLIEGAAATALLIGGIGLAIAAGGYAGSYGKYLLEKFAPKESDPPAQQTK